MHWLGRIYEGQESYPEDHVKAFHWLSCAASHGDAQSQCELGVCYFHGLGTPASAPIAAEWYRKAARQGDEWACYLLGLCYRDGRGVRKNKRVALTWFKKAAQRGVKEARRAMVRLD